MRRYIKLSFSLIFLVNGCSSPIYNPEFTVTRDSVVAAINEIVESEKIYIEGIKGNLSDTIILSLTAGFTNVRNLSGDSSSFLELQKRIAIKLKSFLKDPDQFNTYNISFGYKERNGIGTESGILSGHTFQNAELK